MISEFIYWFFVIILWVSIGAIFHSYILYPILLKILSLNKSVNNITFKKSDTLPKVSILMSLFNEEEVIAEKIESIYNTDYPLENIQVIIGSDNSTDNTNKIVSEYSNKYPSLIFKNFEIRQGKGNIINNLIELSTGEILILSDANVMLDTNTIFDVIKHFKNKDIGLVDTNMNNKGIKKDGISIQEKAYISREVIIKNQESKIWGTMIGPFGGCFAIRKRLYTKVPKNFLVDDFYINMKVLDKGYFTINDLNAKVYEDVSNNIKDEFRRKIRIATGNFQNLKEFSHLLNPFKGLGFSFLSHKVIRWLGPFFIIATILSCSYLSFKSQFYLYLLFLISFGISIPVIDYLLRKLKIHVVPLRFITHFFSMNLALLIGFFKFLKGVKTNVWKPTKRNQ